MTEAQIDLEFEHMKLDKALKDEASGAKVYVDEEYERAEEEEARIDAKLYIEDDFEEPEPTPLPKSENDDEDKWEDVEIDDLDSPSEEDW